MRKMLIAVCAAAFTLSGAAALADSHGKLKLALVPKAMNNPFFDLARDGCYKAQAEEADIECVYIGPGEHTELEQLQIVQDLISQGVDGIAVAPSNAPAMAKVLKAAVKAGIPVMTWDADVLEEDKGVRATYVGTKNYDIGVNLAKIAQSLQPNGGSLCLQTGGAAAANHKRAAPGHPGHPRRHVRHDASGQQACGRERLDRDRRVSAHHGRRRQQGGPGPYRHPGRQPGSDRVHLDRRVHPVVRQRLSPGGRSVQGEDGLGRPLHHRRDTLPMQMAQLKDGLSNGQVGQRPFEMGYKSMFILRELVKGMEVDDPIYTGLDVCTMDNADTCLAQ